eukprot:Hpha_TRINITY_DN16210_c0_g3::TRINITY_DN16210_c0_g3_i2::g.14039::m.14039
MARLPLLLDILAGLVLAGFRCPACPPLSVAVLPECIKLRSLFFLQLVARLGLARFAPLNCRVELLGGLLPVFIDRSPFVVALLAHRFFTFFGLVVLQLLSLLRFICVKLIKRVPPGLLVLHLTLPDGPPLPYAHHISFPAARFSLLSFRGLPRGAVTRRLPPPIHRAMSFKSSPLFLDTPSMSGPRAVSQPRGGPDDNSVAYEPGNPPRNGCGGPPASRSGLWPPLQSCGRTPAWNELSRARNRLSRDKKAVVPSARPGVRFPRSRGGGRRQNTLCCPPLGFLSETPGQWRRVLVPFLIKHYGAPNLGAITFSLPLPSLMPLIYFGLC